MLKLSISKIRAKILNNETHTNIHIFTLNTWDLGVFWKRDLSITWSIMTKIGSTKIHFEILKKMVFKMKVRAS